jgi:dinuclear metal center YbgI/SA1388 family protein
MLTVANVLQALRDWAPLELAWERDNIGLLAGSKDVEVERVLVCLDLTEEVAKEAAALSCDLIVSHHPVIFHPLKSILTDTEQGFVISTCLKNDISVISMHTNADATYAGLNYALAEKLGLRNITALSPADTTMDNLVFFTEPEAEHNESFFHALKRLRGTRWTASQFENGIARIEVNTPSWNNLEVQSIARSEFGESMITSQHSKLSDAVEGYGIGAIGTYDEAMPVDSFIASVKTLLDCDGLRTTPMSGSVQIRKVALCGGSGASYIKYAVAAGADAFVSADFSYHEFQDFRKKILLVDAGHYETEQVFIDLCSDVLRKAFPAGETSLEINSTRINTNPVRFA